MKNQYDAITSEVKPQTEKKTWVAPCIEIIGVESGASHLAHEASATAGSKFLYAS